MGPLHTPVHKQVKDSTADDARKIDPYDLDFSTLHDDSLCPYKQESTSLRSQLERAERERDAAQGAVVYWRDATGHTLDRATEQLREDLDDRDRQIAALQEALREHNNGCIESCGATSSYENVRKNRMCEAYTSRNKTCPDCPRDWMIDDPLAAIPTKDAKEAK